ncbi:cytochrome P450 superfamily protein [Tasmannia lanceolata]|uniref:cytochrome P450 superfamily protein n=1 Tax=Tasmannia lanceolata TaxID=3420 RepID=UPI00406291C9
MERLSFSEEIMWVLGIWVLVSVGWWWCKKMKKRERNGIPKGSLGWPLIGETLDFIACSYTSKPVSFMDKRRSLYGKVFKSHILGRPIIVSTDVEVNKAVLQNDGRTFIPYYPKSVSLLLGETSILKINGNLQKRVHGLIGGFLKSPQLKARITQEIEECVDATLGNWKKGQLVYLQDETKKITFQVLVRALMSVGPGEEIQFLMKEFREFVSGLICLPIKLPGTRLSKSLKAKERMLKFVKRIIEEKMKREEKGLVTDVIDVFLNEMNDTNELQLSINFICGNIVEMMIPGEDSVPMLMTLAVKYLSDCPLALKLLMEENTELKRQKNHLGERYSWTDYMSLPFTHNVINETLRMANIINAVWRKALKDVEIKGYLIPKGWCILASFSSIHMNEENYENPYHFDPWRWQSKEGSSPNNFTPFGGGQRLCPGLELSRLEVSIFLHHFVLRHRWVAEEDFVVNFPTVKMKRRLPIRVAPISS